MWERLRAGGEGGDKRMRQLDGTVDSTDMSLSKLWNMVKDREARRAAVHGAAKSWARLSDWTTAAPAWAGLTPSFEDLERKRGFLQEEGFCSRSKPRTPKSTLLQPSLSTLWHQLFPNLLPTGLSRRFQTFQLPNCMGQFFTISLSPSRYVSYWFCLSRGL